MYKLFLCVRYLLKRRIAFFAIAAVSLCVAMVLIVVSVMGGFLQMVRDNSRGLLGDLIVEVDAIQGFPYYEEFIDEMKSDDKIGPMVEQASPVLITYGVLRHIKSEDTRAVVIVGYRLDEICNVNDFRSGLFYERYYPGTTTFKPQKQPFWGTNRKRQKLLTEEHEQAFAKWKETASPEDIENLPIEPRVKDLYGKPGLFREGYDETTGQFTPGWEGNELPGVIIGVDLCADRLDAEERMKQKGDYWRSYARGDKVEVVCLTMSEGGSITDATPPERIIGRYVDDSQTGIFDIDSMSVYVDFDLLQKTLDMDYAPPVEQGDGTFSRASLARTRQIQIRLKPDADPMVAKQLITDLWTEFSTPLLSTVYRPSLMQRVKIRTWEEKQAKFLGAVEKEKVLVTTLFGVISVVAIFLVGCIFYMIVQQNTRDIGIVKSVGATAWGVAGIFVSYGIAIGIVGGALGLLIGVTFVLNINEIQDYLASWNPALKMWDPAIYAFDTIPNQVKAMDVIVIYLIAIAASMIGSLMAAARAAMVWPVEALRYE